MGMVEDKHCSSSNRKHHFQRCRPIKTHRHQLNSSKYMLKDAARLKPGYKITSLDLYKDRLKHIEDDEKEIQSLKSLPATGDNDCHIFPQKQCFMPNREHFEDESKNSNLAEEPMGITVCCSQETHEKTREENLQNVCSELEEEEECEEEEENYVDIDLEEEDCEEEDDECLECNISIEFEELVNGCFSVDRDKFERICYKYLQYDECIPFLFDRGEIYGDENKDCYCDSEQLSKYHWAEIKQKLNEYSKKLIDYKNKYGDISCVNDNVKKLNALQWCLCLDRSQSRNGKICDKNAGGDTTMQAHLDTSGPCGPISCVTDKRHHKKSNRKLSKRSSTSISGQRATTYWQMGIQNKNCNHPYTTENEFGDPDKQEESFYDEEIDDLFVIDSPTQPQAINDGNSSDDNIYFQPNDDNDAKGCSSNSFYTDENESMSNIDIQPTFLAGGQDVIVDRVSEGINKIFNLVDDLPKSGAFAYRTPLGHGEEELKVHLMSYTNDVESCDLYGENPCCPESEGTEHDASVNGNCNIEEIEFNDTTDAESNAGDDEEDSIDSDEYDDVEDKTMASKFAEQLRRGVDQCVLAGNKGMIPSNTSALVVSSSQESNSSHDVAEDLDHKEVNLTDSESDSSVDDIEGTRKPRKRHAVMASFKHILKSWIDGEGKIQGENDESTLIRQSSEGGYNTSVDGNDSKAAHHTATGHISRARRSPEPNGNVLNPKKLVTVCVNENVTDTSNEPQKPQSMRNPTPIGQVCSFTPLSDEVVDIDDSDGSTVDDDSNTETAPQQSYLQQQKYQQQQNYPPPQSYPPKQNYESKQNYQAQHNNEAQQSNEQRESSPASKGMFSFKPPSNPDSAPNNTIIPDVEGGNERPSYVLSPRARKLIMEQRYGNLKSPPNSRTTSKRRKTSPKPKERDSGDHGENIRFNPPLTKKEIQHAENVSTPVKKDIRKSHIQELRQQTKNIVRPNRNRKFAEARKSEDKTWSNGNEYNEDDVAAEQETITYGDDESMNNFPERDTKAIVRNLASNLCPDGRELAKNVSKRVLVPKGYTMTKKEPDISEHYEERIQRREELRQQRREMMARLSSTAKDQLKPKVISQDRPISPIPHAAAQLATRAKEEYELSKPSNPNFVKFGRQENGRGGPKKVAKKTSNVREPVISNNDARYPWAADRRQRDFYKKYGNDYQGSVDSPFSQMFDEKQQKQEPVKLKKSKFANERYRLKRMDPEVDPYDVKTTVRQPKVVEEEEDMSKQNGLHRVAQQVNQMTKNAKSIAQLRNQRWKPKSQKREPIRSPTSTREIYNENKIEEIVVRQPEVPDEPEQDPKYRMMTYKIKSKKDTAQIMPACSISQAAGEDPSVQAVNMYKPGPEEPEIKCPSILPTQPPEQNPGLLSKLNPLRLFWRPSQERQVQSFVDVGEVGDCKPCKPENINQQLQPKEDIVIQSVESDPVISKDQTVRHQGSSVDVLSPCNATPEELDEAWRNEAERLKQQRKEKLKGFWDSKRRKDEHENNSEQKKYNRSNNKDVESSETTVNLRQFRMKPSPGGRREYMQRKRADAPGKYNVSNNCSVDTDQSGQAKFPRKNHLSAFRPQIDFFAEQKNSNSTNNAESRTTISIKQRLDKSYADGMAIQSTLQLLIEWYVISISVLIVLFITFLCPCLFSKMLSCPIPSICGMLRCLVLTPVEVVTSVAYGGSKTSSFKSIESPSKKKIEQSVKTPEPKPEPETSQDTWVFSAPDPEPETRQQSWFSTPAASEPEPKKSWFSSPEPEPNPSKKSWFSNPSESEPSKQSWFSTPWFSAPTATAPKDKSKTSWGFSSPVKDAAGQETWEKTATTTLAALVTALSSFVKISADVVNLPQWAGRGPQMYDPNQKTEDPAYNEEVAENVAKLRSSDPIFHIYFAWETNVKECDISSIYGMWLRATGTYPSHCQ